MGTCSNNNNILIIIRTFLVVCLLYCVVLGEPGEKPIAKREVHRIILKSKRPSRSHKHHTSHNHNHHHHKDSYRGRDHSREHDDYSREHDHSRERDHSTEHHRYHDKHPHHHHTYHHSKNHDHDHYNNDHDNYNSHEHRGHKHKNHKGSREKDASYENNDSNDYDRSNEKTSLEKFHDYNIQSHYKPSFEKPQLYSTPNTGISEYKNPGEWTPSEYTMYEEKPSQLSYLYDSPTTHSKNHRGKRGKSKKTTNLKRYKNPILNNIQLTTAFPQRAHFPPIIYETTEFPYLENAFNTFNNKAIDTVNSPILVKTGIQSTKINIKPFVTSRPFTFGGYQVKENTKDDVKVSEPTSFNALSPDLDLTRSPAAIVDDSVIKTTNADKNFESKRNNSYRSRTVNRGKSKSQSNGTNKT